MDETSIGSNTQIIVKEPNVDEVVEKIVTQWNTLVVNVQNTTINLCLMIQELTKDYPNETTKEIMDRVRKHPKTKRFVSTDRIWQGLRLVKRRPELIEWSTRKDTSIGLSTNVPELKERAKPYLKPDGEIFWEFYFELEKSPLSPAIKDMLEDRAKEEKWSYRELKKQLRDAREEMDHPGAYEVRKKQKAEYMKQINGILSGMEPDELKDILQYLENLKEKKVE